MNSKKFAIKALILYGLLFMADRGIGVLLEWMYFNQKGEDYYFTTKTLDEQTCELVILGSSRARNHYDPEILEDSLGMSCYNAGRSGCFLVYQSAQLDMILDRYTPRMIVLEVTPYDMKPGEGDYDRLSGLLPYQHHVSFKKVIAKKSPWEQYKCWSRIYPYNSLCLKMVKNLKDRGEFKSNGFQPLDGEWHEPIGDYGTAGGPVDKCKIGEMVHIMDVCKQKNIALVVVTSPMFVRCKETITLAITDSLCRERGIAYYSFLNNPAYEDGRLYNTSDHLNAAGAEMFSREIAHKLKKQLADACQIPTIPEISSKIKN